MPKLLYIQSLHRPFNQQLKTTRWVCEFVQNSKETITVSRFNLKFYIHLINLLNEKYKIHTITEYNGLPSKIAVNFVFEFINGKSENQLIKEIPLIIQNRKTSLDKQIYSTYKAASYFVNLAKDKFKLIDKNNQLNNKGKILVNCRSSFFKLSSKEKSFFFLRILEIDFHFFIANCFFVKLQKKYKLRDIQSDQFDFLDKLYGTKHFSFTSSSLNNFNKVRSYWIKELGVLDSRGKIRKKYNKLITENGFNDLFFEINERFEIYEKENFKIRMKYVKRKNKFLEVYNNYPFKMFSDLGFINLYDIKSDMNISYLNFQLFLEDFYEKEKSKYKIFYNNTVNSIDRRKRFYIRNRPVINIKIK